VQITLALVK